LFLDISPPFVSAAFGKIPQLIAPEGEIILTPPKPSPRRRGAQLGNTNALKHGFYSRRFLKSEMDDLETTNYTGLRDEIAMLRVCIRRIIEWGVSIQDFPEALNFLRVVSLATASLSRLVRTQEAIAGSDMESALEKAIGEVAVELGIMDPPSPAESSLLDPLELPSSKKEE